MYKIDARCVISGDAFSPRLAEDRTGIKLSNKEEVGDLGRVGIYRNKPLPYGSAYLYPPKEALSPMNSYAGFDWLIDKLEEVIEIYRDCGADDIYLDLAVYYDEQCNMAFEPETLGKIAKVKIPFWISCYEYDDLDNIQTGNNIPNSG